MDRLNFFQFAVTNARGEFMGRWDAPSRDDYEDQLRDDRPERCANYVQTGCVGLVADLDGEPFCASCLFKREQFRKATAKAALPLKADEGVA